ncbi:MAG: bifunctional adenosylcobinamide kinase/adenosylcobinamide-phosphate guanylyltransferase [Muribaculaceae bacterium]|nr:bifunctional adenosylcobinamide kinase/adenosylcobinamide-phosphate guanylyltransferase [Muribaculaceae bacterium]MDE6787237.1 bifunctional adenosylcobinamide kinase/adenosylcobinamide-phosphate guanylyltransferase [Muribaculaceae bacterium]
MARFIMVTGGQRSGKSVFAENLALQLSEHPTYLATARVLDKEMENRVAIHKERRKDVWRNIEAPLYADVISFEEKEVVLIDCLTLWATNWFFEKNEDVNGAALALKEQIESLHKKDATFIIVTNEVGLGGVSANSMQRKFADLQGDVNQYVASIAEEVYLTISGIPVKIK